MCDVVPERGIGHLANRAAGFGARDPQLGVGGRRKHLVLVRRQRLLGCLPLRHVRRQGVRRPEQEQGCQRQGKRGNHYRVEQPAEQRADGTQRLALQNASSRDEEITVRAEVGDDVGAVTGFCGLVACGHGCLAFRIEREVHPVGPEFQIAARRIAELLVVTGVLLVIAIDRQERGEAAANVATAGNGAEIVHEAQDAHPRQRLRNPQIRRRRSNAAAREGEADQTFRNDVFVRQLLIAIERLALDDVVEFLLADLLEGLDPLVVSLHPSHAATLRVRARSPRVRINALSVARLSITMDVRSANTRAAAGGMTSRR